MEKKSKLHEKSVRIPEVRQSQWDKVITEYIESVKGLNSESARSQRFLLLLNELFGLQPGFIEDYLAGVEKYVRMKQKDRILKGRIDELFGNLIIEFERDLGPKLTEAEEQLRKYVACLWSYEAAPTQTPYLCLATDGLHFAVYSPSAPKPAKEEISPEDVILTSLERVDWSSFPPQAVYFWLDRYFLRKETLSPKTEDIIKDFGIRSHAFQVAFAILFVLWQGIKGRSETKVIYDGWERYLRIVYGSTVADEELFCRHTYLATLAKLMVWNRLFKSQSPPDNNQILSVLGGRFFHEQGIENFLEEDFFSWIVREEAKDTGVEIARGLWSLLRNYNLRELSEDVLKSLYQELVDPRTRHDLGEFYTPDWLAHRMVQKLIAESPERSFLDPACGSGTFLYLIIREKRNKLPDTQNTLDHILHSVFGVDIHPLATIIAKTNYLLALGDLIKKRKAKGKISIPVYLSDAIRLPERWAQAAGADYKIELDGKVIYLPEKFLESPTLYDEAIDAAREFAQQNINKDINESQFLSYLGTQHTTLTKEITVIQALFRITKAMKELIESRRDTIWAFILKNIYKPLFLKGKFDFVVGNPPWLAFRYADPQYQQFLKEQITKTYNLLSGRGELITHLELGTLFLLRAAHLYLKVGGTIGFVLPRSIFTADQHDGLRQGRFKLQINQDLVLQFREVWDLEEVKPLFQVPSCVLYAERQKQAKVSYPIRGQRLRGKLPRRNASLNEAEVCLERKDIELYLHQRGKRSFWAIGKGLVYAKESLYKRRFFQGATIVSRSLWFVEVRASTILGFDPQLPPLVSSDRARREARNNYKDIVMRGNVESRFLYATLLAAELLPCAHLEYRLVVLPLEPARDGYRLINADEAHERGFYHLKEWLNKAQEEWVKGRGAKAESMTIYERLDRVHGLSRQNPQAKYRVLYNASGTYLTACVVEKEPIRFNIGGQEIEARGFVADSKTYCLETEEAAEAYYLVAILNAPLTDRLIKPMQSRGQYGPRDIAKKVLELPIPQYDPSNKGHIRLVQLGNSCSKKVTRWIQSGNFGKTKSIGVYRSKVRQMLKKELDEIDTLVQQILGF